MKTKYSFLIVTGLMFCLYACKKHCDTAFMTNTRTSLIIGKWNIVRDTVYAGVNTGADPAIYIGQPGDYFDFSEDGNVYIREGAGLDTLSYKLLPNNQIDIESFISMGHGQLVACQTPVLTAHYASIVSPLIPLPAGPQQRKVSLSR
jgi:hypothetical protein